jgi:hypothetical protein
MPLSTAQLQTLKADIAGSNDLIPASMAALGFGPFVGLAVNNAALKSPDGDACLAAVYNIQDAAFWVWRTAVLESEFTRDTSVDGTVWSWPQYIGRSQGERDAWARLFMGGLGGANPSLVNVRQGVADIFSGATTGPGSPTAQRTHLLTIARRLAKRIEKLLAAGTGTTASPATMTFEGTVSAQDIRSARNS